MLPLSSLATMIASTLLASLAKSRSRTSCGETGTTAKASLSSLIAAHPTCDNISYTDGITPFDTTNITSALLAHKHLSTPKIFISVKVHQTE